MKIYHLPLLLLALLFWMGCEDDDGPTVTTLNYDGVNDTAPSLPAGTTSFAVYFPPERITPFIGRKLQRVSFYVSGVPQGTRVSVYNQGPDNLTPGDSVLYSRDISARITTTGWYEDLLPSPITLTGAGIWLVIDATVDRDNSFAIGCDAGRNYNPNGDLLRFPAASQYGSFQQISGNQIVNWNIRGVLSAE